MSISSPVMLHLPGAINSLSVLSDSPFLGLFRVSLTKRGSDSMFAGFARLLAAPFEIFSDFLSNLFG
jgi:hypothetical protein